MPDAAPVGTLRSMSTAESVTITVPRSVVGDVVALSEDLLSRMHALLERNTDGALSPSEHEALETLVQMAQFGQLVALSLRGQTESAAER